MTLATLTLDPRTRLHDMLSLYLTEKHINSFRKIHLLTREDSSNPCGPGVSPDTFKLSRKTAPECPEKDETDAIQYL